MRLKYTALEKRFNALEQAFWAQQPAENASYIRRVSQSEDEIQITQEVVRIGESPQPSKGPTKTSKPITLHQLEDGKYFFLHYFPKF